MEKAMVASVVEVTDPEKAETRIKEDHHGIK